MPTMWNLDSQIILFLEMIIDISLVLFSEVNEAVIVLVQ